MIVFKYKMCRGEMEEGTTVLDCLRECNSICSVNKTRK